MSFIYAYKLTKPYSIGETIEIHSDTKILFNAIEEKSFDSETLNYIKNYGIVKCIIVDSQCCIAFAGNNIKLVHDLLDNYYNTTSRNINELINLAFQLHNENPVNDIEFIICYNDSSNVKHLVCIKNHNKHLDEQFCWIGSKKTFEVMQRERIEKNLPIRESFVSAVESGADDGVGGFVIKAEYSNKCRRFRFITGLYTVVSKPRNYKTGEQIKLYDNKEDGGYTVCITEVNDDLYLNIMQINKEIIYSKGIKSKNSSDVIKEKYKYFLIPNDEK